MSSSQVTIGGDSEPAPDDSKNAGAATGVATADDKRDAELCGLVQDWIGRAWPEESQPAEHKIKSTFVVSELQARLHSYRYWAIGWRIAQISLWLLVTLIGLCISVLGGFKSGRGLMIFFGALVATLTTLTNAMHPAREADGYNDARVRLREEGWALVNRTGQYAEAPNRETGPEELYRTFVERVHRIVETKRISTRFNLGDDQPAAQP
jgi:hypothetical protein